MHAGFDTHELLVLARLVVYANTLAPPTFGKEGLPTAACSCYEKEEGWRCIKQVTD